MILRWVESMQFSSLNAVELHQFSPAEDVALFVYLFQISLSWCINVYVAKVNKCIKFVTWADFFSDNKTDQIKSTFLCLSGGCRWLWGFRLLLLFSLKAVFFLTYWQESLGFWGLGAFKFLVHIMLSFKWKWNQCQMLCFLDSKIRVGGVQINCRKLAEAVTWTKYAVCLKPKNLIFYMKS